MKYLLLYVFVTIFSFNVTAQRAITGHVIDNETREPLPSATVRVADTSIGTVTNDKGYFELDIDEKHFNNGHLVVSFIGYKTDTMAINPSRIKYRIMLHPDFSSLQEVVVISGTLKEVSKLNSPIPVEIYSPALFYKNPTPSIFESLGMINGIQPQLNCNVCNTGDIHINGMEGPYTMVLIDGMPIVSSLSTVYGLSGIPNSMVKRIEVVKGPASTLYGSEAVGGLINVITKDAITSPSFKADLFATSYLEYNLDVTTKWRTSFGNSLLGVNYFNYNNRVDSNNDNFTDVTLQNRISVFNKWEFTRKQDRRAGLAMRYVYEDRWGGEMNYEDKYRGSDQVYGESIYTNRVELIGNYQLPIEKELITFDLSYNYHLQDSYYGVTKYYAGQHVAFGQIRWDKKIGRHDLLAGIPFRFTYYDDNTVGTSDGGSNAPMVNRLPGIFIQDELTIGKKTTILSGLRYDYHNHHGSIVSPRVSLKYSPGTYTSFRLSGGNGFRVVNLFTEDHAALTGSREVLIKNELRPEESWNMNLNYTTQLLHRKGFVGLDGSLFYTYFTNKIVGDFISDPQSIIYDNLDGYAVSKGITLNTEFAFVNGLKIIAGVTIMDVYQVEQDDQGIESKIPQLFAPRFSGTYTIGYTHARSNITVDLTGRVNGPMHLPVVPDDYRPSMSPWYSLMNIQLTKSFSNGLEIYGGIKNLLNFVPKDPLLRPFDPFDKDIQTNNPYGYTFDTTYNYAPLQSIRGFVGLRYTLQ